MRIIVGKSEVRRNGYFTYGIVPS